MPYPLGDPMLPPGHPLNPMNPLRGDYPGKAWWYSSQNLRTDIFPKVERCSKCKERLPDQSFVSFNNLMPHVCFPKMTGW